MYLSLLVKDKDGDEVPIAPGLAYNKHPNVLFFFFNLLSDHLLATMWMNIQFSLFLSMKKRPQHQTRRRCVWLMPKITATCPCVNTKRTTSSASSIKLIWDSGNIIRRRMRRQLNCSSACRLSERPGTRRPAAAVGRPVRPHQVAHYSWCIIFWMAVTNFPRGPQTTPRAKIGRTGLGARPWWPLLVAIRRLQDQVSARQWRVKISNRLQTRRTAGDATRLCSTVAGATCRWRWPRLLLSSRSWLLAIARWRGFRLSRNPVPSTPAVTHRTTSSTVRSKNFAVPTPAWKKSIPRLDNDFAKEIPTKGTTSCWAGVAAPSRTAVESKMRDFVQIFLLKQNNFNFILLKESAAGIAWLRSRQPTRRRFVQRRRPGAWKTLAGSLPRTERSAQRPQRIESQRFVFLVQGFVSLQFQHRIQFR